MKKLILPLLLMFAVVFGVTQMANENDVFAKSVQYWCSSGACETLDCETTVSILTFDIPGKPFCNTYNLGTCQECVDLTLQGQTCPSGSYYCLNPD